MMHMLKIEWLKIRKYKAFLILFVLAAAGILAINYLIYGITVAASLDGVPANMANMRRAIIGTTYAFPEVFQTVSYISGFINVLPGLLIILLMSNEYNFRTSRQNVIDGLSRTQFIMGKITLVAIISAAMTLIVFLTACLFGAVSEGEFSFKGIEYVGYFFIQSLAYMSVAMVVVMLFKRAAIAIGLYFIYAVIIENVLAAVISHNFDLDLGKYMPLKSANKLIPVHDVINNMLVRNLSAPEWVLAIAILWIALCLWFCKYRFRRADL